MFNVFYNDSRAMVYFDTYTFQMICGRFETKEILPTKRLFWRQRKIHYTNLRSQCIQHVSEWHIVKAGTPFDKATAADIFFKVLLYNRTLCYDMDNFNLAKIRRVIYQVSICINLMHYDCNYM